MDRTALAVGGLLAVLALLAGCQPDEAPPPEPLDLPADPAEYGVPVGARTLEIEGLTVEVWYPAPDAVAEDADELVDFMQFVPAPFLEAVPGFQIPSLSARVARDAPLRVPEEPYPTIVYSHGFGGTRYRSLDYTVHLASRGYVVVAADHDGRRLADILPCLLNPPLEGCDLLALMEADDTAPPHIDILADWLFEAAADDPLFKGAVAPERMALTGHSFGAYTSTTVGDDDERFSALLPMAAGGELTRSVPTLLMAGTCDLTVPLEKLQDAYATFPDGQMLEFAGAGHLAFCDVCALDFATAADQYLWPHDDVNALFLEQMIDLSTDGCPGYIPEEPPFDDCADGFLPLETSAPIIRHYATVFFDQQLRGTGPGVTAGEFDEVALH